MPRPEARDDQDVTDNMKRPEMRACLPAENRFEQVPPTPELETGRLNRPPDAPSRALSVLSALDKKADNSCATKPDKSKNS